jgi:hypothetical protein
MYVQGGLHVCARPFIYYLFIIFSKTIKNNSKDRVVCRSFIFERAGRVEMAYMLFRKIVECFMRVMRVCHVRVYHARVDA